MSFIYKENSLSSKHGTEILFKSQSSDNTTPSDAIKFIKTDKRCHGNHFNTGSRRLPFQWLKMFIMEAFFPEGYPDSVSSDYVAYQAWDTVQAFASSISGSLATKAVLEGVGVGDENATSLSATITWLLRQGAGMVGQIMFTWIQGSDLDHNCKRWRLFADILNDAAMCIELSGPLWSPVTLQFILCFASVARSLVGVAGGATRTAITQHQARAGNISDVAAKDGSQETLVNLVALMVNLIVLPLVSEDMALTWILFLSLTMLHLYANFKAVSSLCFETLNKDRLIMVLKSYERNQFQKVDTPVEINKRENVFIGGGLSEQELFTHKQTPAAHSISINIGPSFERILKQNGNMSIEASSLKTINNDLTRTKFSVVPFLSGSKNYEYNILLAKSWTGEDLLKAYFVAYRMASKLFDSNSNHSNIQYNEEFVCFRKELANAGWKLGQLQLNTQGFTGHFAEDEKRK